MQSKKFGLLIIGLFFIVFSGTAARAEDAYVIFKGFNAVKEIKKIDSQISAVKGTFLAYYVKKTNALGRCTGIVFFKAPLDAIKQIKGAKQLMGKLHFTMFFYASDQSVTLNNEMERYPREEFQCNWSNTLSKMIKIIESKNLMKADRGSNHVINLRKNFKICDFYLRDEENGGKYWIENDYAVAFYEEYRGQLTKLFSAQY